MVVSESDIRTVKHTASGTSIKIHPYGATVLSYITNERENLFVSKSAILDGSKPIRGGIPLVFPIFGPPTLAGSTMPQHGYARRNVWNFVKEYDTTESAGIVYELKLDNVETGIGENNSWVKSASLYDCTLELTVDFTADQMTTKLKICNTGKRPFPFQALLHTYYAIDDNAALKPDQCFVQGLERYSITDKVSTGGDGVANNDPITISGEVDRVYSAPNTKKSVIDVTIGVGGNKTIKMKASGVINGDVSVPVDCVVWNPFKEKAAGMSDFGNDEYHNMICVEPGILGDNIVIQPGMDATLTQIINV